MKTFLPSTEFSLTEAIIKLDGKCGALSLISSTFTSTTVEELFPPISVAVTTSLHTGLPKGGSLSNA